MTCFYFQSITYFFMYYSDLIVIDFITLCICCWLYESHQTAGAVGHAGGARPGSLAKGASRTRTPFGRRRNTWNDR